MEEEDKTTAIPAPAEVIFISDTSPLLSSGRSSVLTIREKITFSVFSSPNASKTEPSAVPCASVPNALLIPCALKNSEKCTA